MDNKIVIDIEETEKTVLGEDNEVISSNIDGVLSVKNESERSRIWNTKLSVTGNEDTDLNGNTIPVGEIEYASDYKIEYGMDIKKPSLIVEEIFDVFPGDEDIHSVYVNNRENPVRITITLKNESSKPAESISLVKYIPDGLNVNNITPSSGNTVHEENTVTWDGISIYPGESTNLVIECSILINDVSERDTGITKVEYTINGIKRSKLEVELDAVTELLVGSDTSEVSVDEWECIVECTNDSDIPVCIKNTSLDVNGNIVIDESIDHVLKEGESLDKKANVKSSETPKCVPDVKFSVISETITRIKGVIEKSVKNIPTLAIGYTKSFNPPSVDSFEKTPVDIIIELTNTGTAPISGFVINDKIPSDVVPPKNEFVTFSIDGNSHNDVMGVECSPPDASPDIEHKMMFTFNDMKEKIGTLEPNKSIKIVYTVMTWKSKPEKEYYFPIECSAFAIPPREPVIEKSNEDVHQLEITYKRRRVSTKKSINRSDNEGSYKVVILIENKGEVSVENISVVDLIPSGFSYISTQSDDTAPKIEDTSSGSNAIWNITKMNPGDSLRIEMNVEGTGDYIREEPVVTYD